MSGVPPPSPGPRPPGRQRSGLRALSGTLSLSAAASAWAEAAPALRSELSHSHRPHQPAAQAPFAMRPLDPAASLEMFKRMRGGPPSAPGSERTSPAKPHAPLPLRLGDSARHTETEGGTPTSQRSLLESVDEGWGPSQPPPMQPAADAAPAGSGSAAGNAGQTSPFAAAAAARQPSPPGSGLVSPPSGRGSEALPPGLRAELLAQLSAMHAATAPALAAPPLMAPATQPQEQLGALGGGADTPHSAASWPSMLSGTASALPQTEAELQGLDAVDVERLAAEAAELQARAATALRLAQRRLQAAASASRGSPQQAEPTAASVGGVPASAPAAASVGSPPASAPAPVGDGSPLAAAPAAASADDLQAAEPAPAQACPVGPPAYVAAAAPPAPALPSLPPAAQRLLQLYILLLALAEALLLWAAQAVRVGSGGLLRVPRSLALAPLAPARAALPALLLTADACLVLLALLRQRWAAAGL